MQNRGVMDCNSNGPATGEPLGRMKRVGGGGGRTYPPGSILNEGQSNAFGYFPHGAPRELDFHPLCAKLWVSPNVCRVPERAWAAALEISGTGIIPVHGEH